MISTWFGKRPRTADLDWIRQLSAACEPSTRSAITSSTRTVDLRSTFTAVGPPTLLICGQRDKAASPKISERIADAIDGAEAHLVSGAGHMVIIEKPDAIVELLVRWVSRLS